MIEVRYYAEYWIAYQGCRTLNMMPGQSEWIIKPYLYPALMGYQLRGLGVNGLMDMAEYAIGVDEQIFDEGEEEAYIIPIIGEGFDFGPKAVLSGIHRDGSVDLCW